MLSSRAMSTEASPRLHLFAILVALFALVLNVAGSLVNSLQAAGSIPDWPLSYGHWFLQDWAGNTVYAYSHRLLAAATGLLTILLALWIRKRETIGSLRGIAWMAVTFVGLQILLGGVIALTSSPPLIATAHVFLSQVFFALTFYLAVATSPRWIERRTELDPGELGHKHLRWVKIMMWLMFLQVLAGGATRHPSGELLYGVALLLHVLNALALLVVIHIACIMVIKAARESWPAKAGFAMLALLLVQISVGIGVFVVAPEPLNETWPPPAGFVGMHAIHVGTSSLMLAISVSLAITVRKLTAGRATA